MRNVEDAPSVRQDLGIFIVSTAIQSLISVKEYAEPYKNAASTGDISRTPEQQARLNQHIQNKKQGIGIQRHAFVGRGLLTI